VTKAYDSTESGTGGYSVGPSNLFTIIDADGTPKNILATDGNTAKVKRSSDLPASRVHDKRTSFNGCSPDQQSEITAAISSAKSYASDAYSYIAGISSGTTRYTTWFGEYDQNHKDKVEEHFRLISNSPFEGFFYDCYTCNSLDAFTVVGVYTSRAWDRYLAIDKCLNRIPLLTDPSNFAPTSGKPLPPVPIPRPGRLSTRLPASGATVVITILFSVRLAVRVWPPATETLPPTTPTATGTSQRTTPLWIDCYPHDRKGEGPVVLIPAPVDTSCTRGNFASPLSMILLCPSHRTTRKPRQFLPTSRLHQVLYSERVGWGARIGLREHCDPFPFRVELNRVKIRDNSRLKWLGLSLDRHYTFTKLNMV